MFYEPDEAPAFWCSLVLPTRHFAGGRFEKMLEAELGPLVVHSVMSKYCTRCCLRPDSCEGGGSETEFLATLFVGVPLMSAMKQFQHPSK